jgi:hypothetical protein
LLGSGHKTQNPRLSSRVCSCAGLLRVLGHRVIEPFEVALLPGTGGAR